MMKSEIWKYIIILESTNTRLIPRGAKPLTVQLQNGIPYVWVQVQPGEEKVVHRFYIMGTGCPHDSNKIGEYVGTWQKDGFVWHLFFEGEI